MRAGAIGVREALNAILAELRHDVAFANLYASVDLDAYAPDLPGDEPVDVMAEARRKLWAERGDASARLIDMSAAHKSGTSPTCGEDDQGDAQHSVAHRFLGRDGSLARRSAAATRCGGSSNFRREDKLV